MNQKKMDESELMIMYQNNQDFHDYIEGMRRIHPDMSVEQALRKIIVHGVAEMYRQRES